MASRKKVIKTIRETSPARTPKGRENQLVNLAINLAEQQLKEGTATSQVITHFLKLGTEKEMLEREKLAQENELLKAKADAVRSAKSTEELYESALLAMKTYTGVGGEEL